MRCGASDCPSSSDTADVVCAPPPLALRIAGGDFRTVGRAAVFRLTALPSAALTLGQLLAWTWARPGHHLGELVARMDDNNSSVVVVRAAELEEGVYTFSASVSAGGATVAAAHAEVLVAAGAPPAQALAALSEVAPKFDPSKRLKLRATVELAPAADGSTLRPSVDTVWTAALVAGDGALVALDLLAAGVLAAGITPASLAMELEVILTPPCIFH